MSFAFWRKCDFQVHTPRDPNWIGARPIGAGDIDPATGNPATSEEIAAARADWADAFVHACAAKGLGAVALTDHHETVMVPWVREAILRRQTKEPGFDLWLFPGMELTCQGGVQCLILFDADLTDEWCQQAQGRLGIVYAALDPDKSRAPPVVQITCAYPDIAGTVT